MNAENVLACWRVEDLHLPLDGAVRGHSCADCRAPVWVMRRNLALGFRILCRQCAMTRAVRENDLTVLPASEARRRAGL